MSSKASQEITFDNCAFDPDRRHLSEFLTSFLIKNSAEGFVLNINGAWGTGKTFFSKAWKNELSKQHPCIYIDAWRTDFSNDPLTVIMKELLDELHTLNKKSGIDSKLEEKVLKGLYKITSSTVKMASSVSTTMMGIGPTTGKDAANLLLKNLDAYVENAGKLDFEHYKVVYDAMKNFRVAIKSLLDSYTSTSKKSYPLFIFIDELDRCRPTYAVEVLETIKHIFGLENIVFIVTTNTDELKHSINAVYGSNFSSEEYLDRFFNRSIKLPEPTIRKYLEAAHSAIIDQISGMQKFILPQNIYLLDVMSVAFIAYDYKLRDIDRFMDSLRGVIHWVDIKSNTDTKIDIANLIILMILNKKHPNEFINIKTTENNKLPQINTKATTKKELETYKLSAPFPQIFENALKYQKLYNKLVLESQSPKAGRFHVENGIGSEFEKVNSSSNFAQRYISHYLDLSRSKKPEIIPIEKLAQFVETSSILDSAEVSSIN